MLHKSKVVAAKGVRVIGSVMHFTFQTAADLVLEVEVKTLKKLDVYDLSIKELKPCLSSHLQDSPTNTCNSDNYKPWRAN